FLGTPKEFVSFSQSRKTKAAVLILGQPATGLAAGSQVGSSPGRRFKAKSHLRQLICRHWPPSAYDLLSSRWRGYLLKSMLWQILDIPPGKATKNRRIGYGLLQQDDSARNGAKIAVSLSPNSLRVVTGGR